MKKRILSVALVLCALTGFASAQSSEIKITVGEQFVDSLLNAVFTNLDSPSVAISDDSSSGCNETIRLKREVDGVKTSVRFRGGEISAPLAFEGNYNPPLIGCIDFSGWADTTIDIVYDRNRDAIVGRARVSNVNLSGTGGVGSSLLARFVQSSIDEKVNPIEIVKLDKLSFLLPIQNSGKLRMKATNVRHQVRDRTIDIYIAYEFVKAS
ncbi:MAG: hypothetical protein HKN25_15710 [Pyrinomonadaceae bacterium]|nr:hypothetical protein [Pyrinomonadaceae bacterium]